LQRYFCTIEEAKLKRYRKATFKIEFLHLIINFAVKAKYFGKSIHQNFM